MATIELQQVTKKFGEAYAVKPMSLLIRDGEFVVLLGPSGCGKTTTLRMIAGLETVSEGAILLEGDNVTTKLASERDIAMVFQFFALYPHMTVRQNIAFPLEAQSESTAKIDTSVAEVVKLLDIEQLLPLRPRALSGGDRQRVALARALVRRPAAFLMDEPLGALDAEFRDTMRAEIKRLHLRQHATTVYVTHDQIEAMAMADRIVVMSAAVVQQVGTPHAVYHNPANLFVARFIGSPGMNLLRGRHEGGTIVFGDDNTFPVPTSWRAALAPHVEIVVGFRPEAALLCPDGPLAATVYADDLHGAHTMLHLTVGGTENPEEIVHARADRAVNFPIGACVRFDLADEGVRFFDPATELAIIR